MSSSEVVSRGNEKRERDALTAAGRSFGVGGLRQATGLPTGPSSEL
ncbi:hypothetical protein [Pseudoclavibacter helvolus]|uniref:Uncharacterized protein n=1 Tax=Pseudoclavibacter helvolus TaxID=255205 RepID=A0A7W4YG00_9MICO|nr:hypothetical protein [Pseudoclavibacter helvolus]MBB2959089.1 hypothetical protein [Pseudoclavibacter helvolus]